MAREIGVPHCRFERVRGEKSPCHLCKACALVARDALMPADGLPSTFVGRSGCILCGMCVRLCDDVMKIGALGFEGRGHAPARHHPVPGTLRILRHLRRLQFHLPDRAPSSCCASGPRNRGPSRPSSSLGLANRKPIYIPFPQAVPRVPVIDTDVCVNFMTGGCKVCEDNCQAKAIDHTAAGPHPGGRGRHRHRRHRIQDRRPAADGLLRLRGFPEGL